MTAATWAEEAARSGDGPALLAVRLAELRLRFLDTIELRLAELGAWCDLLGSPEADAIDRRAGLDGIRYGAHKTLGLAATLGYEALGAAAGRVELALDSHLRGGPEAPALPDLLTLTELMLDEMARALTEAGR